MARVGTGKQEQTRVWRAVWSVESVPLTVVGTESGGRSAKQMLIDNYPIEQIRLNIQWIEQNKITQIPHWPYQLLNKCINWTIENWAENN